MSIRRTTSALAASAVALLVLAGCEAPRPERTVATATPPASASATPTSAPTTTPTTPPLTGSYTPTGELTALANGLAAPWSIAPVGADGILISERDSAQIVLVDPAGQKRAIGGVGGVAAAGEGGLLGIAVHGDGAERRLFAYFTTDGDNRVVSFPLTGAGASLALGPATEVITGLPKASNHNGGRIAFGPDGMLYITTGDANQREGAQDPGYLGGKILRLDASGSVPTDNPIAGSPVYSLGHRNPQGIAWGPDGTMYAAEFGQDTWDELNVIVPGANYGWPVVEGIDSADTRFVAPIAQWGTDDASPSGIAVVGDTVFMAGLGGERLWTIDPTQGAQPREFFAGQLGRIRDVYSAGDGSLLLITNNTDGRGEPRSGDDTLYRVTLAATSG
ncbi:Glucose/arabinose dehydrogenase, beta-propeller fold [Agreia bicolorata]|uniref:Glucose/arabinose dehydrogenase, beta-propeller fold n=1 Tax=Agreia bicolorata TaxID=110935 RepID=A0A1T4XN61_9MICO|nr:PQQ-dependent sugar dehydrogenase [Agreia bicolorata]SKA90979.1 Glucose/arabinose dehydrogenase, beta-propeller fold [Agreia bicolorata]